MLTTLMCDASWDPKTHVAGYGYWIVNKRGKKGGGSSFRGKIVDAGVAELMAVANSLCIGVREDLIQVGDQVLIQTDCLGVIHLFTGQRLPRKGQESDAYAVIRRVEHLHKLSIRLRHVKGHAGSMEKRAIANRLCDERAKQAMRKARAKQQCEDQLRGVLL